MKRIIPTLENFIAENKDDYQKFLNYVATAKIKNPETGRDILIKTALNYPKDSPVYKIAYAKASTIYKPENKKS